MVESVVVVAYRLHERPVDGKRVAFHDGRADQGTGRVGRLQEDRGQCPRHDVDIVVGRLEEAHIGQEVVGVGDGYDGWVVPDSGQ